MYRAVLRGSRITISTSKIRKRIVTRKNRREKGIRALLRGSNPHSKGVSFSRCLDEVLPIAIARAIKEVESLKAISAIVQVVSNNRSYEPHQ